MMPLIFRKSIDSNLANEIVLDLLEEVLQSMCSKVIRCGESVHVHGMRTWTGEILASDVRFEVKSGERGRVVTAELDPTNLSSVLRDDFGITIKRIVDLLQEALAENQCSTVFCRYCGVHTAVTTDPRVCPGCGRPSDYHVSESEDFILPTLMMICPEQLPAECIVDGLTRRATALLRSARPGCEFCGFHTCICGAMSSSCNLIVSVRGQRMLTNSLLPHYVAYHRPEIPDRELELVAKVINQAAPIPPELFPPPVGTTSVCDWPPDEELIQLAATPRLFTFEAYSCLQSELQRRQVRDSKTADRD